MSSMFLLVAIASGKTFETLEDCREKHKGVFYSKISVFHLRVKKEKILLFKKNVLHSLS